MDTFRKPSALRIWRAAKQLNDLSSARWLRSALAGSIRHPETGAAERLNAAGAFRSIESRVALAVRSAFWPPLAALAVGLFALATSLAFATSLAESPRATASGPFHIETADELDQSPVVGTQLALATLGTPRSSTRKPLNGMSQDLIERIGMLRRLIAASPADADNYYVLARQMCPQLNFALTGEPVRPGRRPCPTGTAEAPREVLAPKGRFPDEFIKRLTQFDASQSDAVSTLTVALAQQVQTDPLPSLVVGPVGQVLRTGGVGFIPPVGWTVTSSDGVVVMEGPVAPADAPCSAVLLAPMPAGPDSAVQAEALVNGLLAEKLGPYRSEFEGDVKLTRYEGVSGTGWPYVDLFGQLGRGPVYARVLLARMGTQVVSLMGVTKSRNCMGAMRENDVWSLLFHSLQLPGFAEDSPQLKQQLLGTWESVSSTVYVSESYAANGHCAKGGAHSTYTESALSPGILLQKTSDWRGDGSYEVHGDRLTTRISRGAYAGYSVTRLFSIVRQPDSNRPDGFSYILRTVDHASEPTWGFSPNGNYVGALTKE